MRQALTEGLARRSGVAVALLLGAEAAVLFALGRGLHAGLETRSWLGPVLLWLHEATLVLAGVAALAVLSGLWQPATRHIMLTARRSAVACGLHLAAFVTTAGGYAALATGGRGAALDPVAVGGALVWLAGATALLIPPTARTRGLRLLLGGGAALAAAWGLVAQLAQLPLMHLQAIIEDLTLRLTLRFLDLLHVAPIEILRDAAAKPVLLSQGFVISIAASCAGYEGVAGAATLILLYAMAERQRLHNGRAALLALAACGAVFLINALRIALLFAIGAGGWADLALNGFHSHFGAVGLLLVMAGAVAALQLPAFQRSAAPRAMAAAAGDRPADTLTDALPTIMPLAGMTMAGLLLGLLAGPVNWLYPLPVMVGAAMVWRGWPSLRPRFATPALPRAAATGAAVYVMWISLVPPDLDGSALIGQALGAAPAAVALVWLGLRTVGAAIAIPLLEEMAFRGGIQPALAAWLARQNAGRLGPWIAAALAALGFGLLHQDAVAGTLAGLAYGALTLKGRGLSDAVVAHATTNALLAAHVLVTGQYSYW
ncbi:CAAX prenyl protease-related protein [Rhodobacter xanthinilyticus]|nr:CAAX prenyl protease-related protein [Rhodobacter xanthinilyticus]